MLTRDRIETLIPHAGAMCLLDRVVAWDDATIECHAWTHQSGHAHPLAHDGAIAAVHLIEYGAQAAAVHAALSLPETARQRHTEGFLVALRNVDLAAQTIDMLAAPLTVAARREAGGAQGMIYCFTVSSAGAVVSAGRLTIMAAA